MHTIFQSQSFYFSLLVIQSGPKALREHTLMELLVVSAEESCLLFSACSVVPPCSTEPLLLLMLLLLLLLCFRCTWRSRALTSSGPKRLSGERAYVFNNMFSFLRHVEKLNMNHCRFSLNF